MKMKPILFNTDMVCAILEDRKAVTRRIMKPQPPHTTHICYNEGNLFWSFWEDSDKHQIKLLYRPGDILYVRETWTECADGYAYKADNPSSDGWGWRPSIHMPRDAARIFLRVTGVRVERLQDITEEQAKHEGAHAAYPFKSYIDGFVSLWNGTIKPADRALYSWEANPWVWVIEFERISKEEAENEKV